MHSKENAHFQNGTLQPSVAQSLKCHFVSDSSTEPEKQMLVAANNDSLYHGVIGEGYPNDLVDTFLAIRNKKTNKMRIIQVQECSLMNEIYDRSSVSMTTSKEMAVRLMTTEFQGKRGRSIYDKNFKNNVNIDVIKDKLDETVRDIPDANEVKEDHFDKGKVERDIKHRSMCPPINEDAKKIGDVYQLHMLIPEKVLNALEEDATAILKDSSDNLFHIPYLVAAINEVKQSKCPDSDENLNKIKICIYLNCLFKLLSLKKQTIIANISTNKTLFEDIRDRFGAPGATKKTISIYTIQKAHNYIIILSALLSNKYEFNLEWLCQGAGRTIITLKKYASTMCTKLKRGSNTIAIKLPSEKTEPCYSSYPRKMK